MRKVIWSLFCLALLTLSSIWNTASAVPVRLQAHNQRSGSGTRSTLMWLDCGSASTGRAPCINFSNPWVAANGTIGSTVTWDWNPTTRVLTSNGSFSTFSAISSNPLGNVVLNDRVADMQIDVINQVTTATFYRCVEGNFLAGVGANGCGSYSLALDFTDNSTVDYNVGGDPYCVNRHLAGDDLSTGNPRGVTNFPGTASPLCDPTNGAFTLYTLLQDNLSTGGTLIVSNGICIGAPGAGTEPQVYAPCSNANWMTFVTLDAVDDGPVNVVAGAPTDIPVMANDVGFIDNVTVEVTTPPGHGTAEVKCAGVAATPTDPCAQANITITYTFTDPPGSAFTDSFVYTVTDTDGFTHDSGTVTLNVSNDDFFTFHPTLDGQGNVVPVVIPIGANDTNLIPAPTDPVTDSIIVPPDHGGSVTLLNNPGSALGVTASYTPAWTLGTATYTEHFTYRITGANAVTDDAVVTVIVTNKLPNATAEAVSISTKGEPPVSAVGGAGSKSAVLGISSGNLGDGPSTVTCEGAADCHNVFTASGRGEVDFNTATNQFTYAIQDPTFFVGTDIVNYTITDADGETSTGTITVTLPDAKAGQFDANDPGDDVFDDTALHSHKILVKGRQLPQILDDSPEDLAGGIVVDCAHAQFAYCPLTIQTTQNTKSSQWAMPIVLGNGDLSQHTTAVVTDGAHGHCEVSGIFITYAPEADFTGNDVCRVSVTDADTDPVDPNVPGSGPDTDIGNVYVTVAAGGGGGGGSGLSGGGGALDFWSLSLLAAASALRRRQRLRC